MRRDQPTRPAERAKCARNTRQGHLSRKSRCRYETGSPSRIDAGSHAWQCAIRGSWLRRVPTATKNFDYTAIPSWARYVVGLDFGFSHPFAAVLIAWAHDTGQVWVLDSFRMERSSALYHTQRIHAMTRGARVVCAWPHDGHQHDKGSGLSLAMQYKNFGANMLPSHAVNHGTNNFSVEPALEEIREMMFTGKLSIAGHNTELLEEMRNYHRDQDFRIVKQRDDMVSALRYAIMSRRKGKPLSECGGVGFGPMQFAGQRAASREPRLARGIDFDLFG